MLYLNYERAQAEYHNTQRQYSEALTEAERLIHGKGYTNAKKRIDKKIEELKILLNEREILLRHVEKELKASQNVEDIIYCYRNFERMKVWKIARNIYYSEAQVYRKLNEIRKKIEDDRK